MKNVALYVRVSTEEQKKHGISVDSQIQALKDYANAQGYNIVGIYNDAGISARKRYTKRPAILKLIKDCECHRVDLILFTKLDRWFRSVADYYEVQSQLDACDVKWRAIWEDYETETSAGVFKVNIMLSIAQAESDRTSERIKSVFEYQRSQGKYVGSVPLGYIRQNGNVVKDEKTRKYVEILFETYLENHTISAVLKRLHDEGLELSRSGINIILKNTAYYGNCNGFECEPYITKNQFDLINDKRKNNGSTRQRKELYLFSGLCICSQCGYRMSGHVVTTNNRRYYNYDCSGIEKKIKHKIGTSISERKLEKYLLENIDSIINNYNVEIESKSKGIDQEEIDKKKKALELKLNRVGVRFEEGDISTDEYKEKRKAIQSEIAFLNVLNPSTKIDLPEGWKAVYDDLDRTHKRSFWYSIIKEIYIYPKMEAFPQITFLP